MISAQSVARSIPPIISVLSGQYEAGSQGQRRGDVGGAAGLAARRPLLYRLWRMIQETHDVENAGGIDGEIDDHEADERGRDGRRSKRRNGVGGAQKAINHIGLAADLGGDPAG